MMGKQRWETKHFVLAGIFAAVTFAVAFMLGTGIIVATGIPATGGIANIFAAVLIVIIGVKLAPRFGFATLTIGLLFTIAIPTIIGGPPGIYKVINGILIGLTADIVLFFGKRTYISHIVAGSLAAVVSIVSIYYAMLILGLPAVEKLKPLLLPLSILQAITGAAGAYVGQRIFDKRLVKIEAVKRLMSQSYEHS